MNLTRGLALVAASAVALAACSSGSGASGTAGGASTGTAAAAATAEALNRVELIAPAAPGSGWDQTSRAVQASLKADSLAKSIEVKNVPGASGTVALAQVASQKGKKDLLVASGLAMMSGIVANGTSVTLNDLTPIARVMGEYEAIVTPKDSPYANVDALFAAIKKDPKSVAIAGGSAGSADQIFIGLLAQHYGVKPADVNYVPFSGGGEATTALLGGKVQAGVAGLNEFTAQVKNGNLKGLLVSSAKPIEGAAYAQTAAQIDPKLEFQNWRSVMAPAGIDSALTQQYVGVLTQMHGGSSWKSALTTNNWNDNFLAGAEFGTWLKEENTRVTAVLSDLGLAKK
ncbi:MAG: tripartite tricarboxylate transporter substrate-binding protein [Lapillicoccus sp.]